MQVDPRSLEVSLSCSPAFVLTAECSKSRTGESVPVWGITVCKDSTTFVLALRDGLRDGRTVDPTDGDGESGLQAA